MSELSPSHKFDFEVLATQEEGIPLQNSPCKTPTQGASREIPIQGASQEKTPSSVDLESMSDDDGDLGYVDIDDFVQLQTRFDALSKSHDHLNQNVTMLIELLTHGLVGSTIARIGAVANACLILSKLCCCSSFQLKFYPLDFN